MDRKRVLFVDDEPNVLSGLRRMLRSLRKGLDMDFVESGREALEAMGENPYDVVISDMKMPGMSGADLLETIRDRYPETIRLVLTGQAHDEAVLRTVGVAHQFLDKPCEPERLKLTLHRVCKLHQILTNEKLRKLVARIDKLPSLPSIYDKIQKLLVDPESSVDDVAQCIASDISMSAKVLQLVNSAFFGLYQHIGSPIQAVHLLGLDTIRSLVMYAQIFSEYEKDNIRIFSLEELWRHSLAVGACAKKIVESETDDQNKIDDAFISGLLHDVGKLILVTNITEQYGQVMDLVDRESLTTWEAEKRVFGAAHAEVGGYLLGLWGLSSSVIEAVVYHHQPSDCPEEVLGPVTAVHAANVLDNEKIGDKERAGGSTLDGDHLVQVGYEDFVADWRELCVVRGEKGE